ncbi:MAG: replication initiator protein A [Methylococcales bacterium]
MAETLLPNRYNQKSFFICDVFDSFKDDIASMEHPVFSLSKKPDHRMLVYEKNGNTIKIKPSYTGLATIFDKDILLYLASALISAKNSGGGISKTVRFTTYDYIVSTNKALGGMQYKQFQEGLERLKGTVINTNIKTNGQEITEEFGLIDKWKTVKDDDNGKVLAVEVVLSDWFYNSIIGNAVLSIDRDYFRLRKPIERRLYELARKHCGNQMTWKIKLDNLQGKLGAISPLRKLRFSMKEIAETNHLPEYNISMEDDVVMFTRKEPPKDNKSVTLLVKPISKKDIEKVARPGETYDQVADRLKKLRASL